MFALSASSTGVQVGLAILTGGVAGGVVTAIFGPIVTAREARKETFRSWQTKLGEEFLMKLAELRSELTQRAGLADASLSRADATKIADLDLLAQRVHLVFREGIKTPEAATRVVAAARAGDLATLDRARDDFVNCASNEIRGRGRLERWRDSRNAPERRH